MTNINILGRMVSMRNEFPKSEKKIADVIIQEPDKVVLMTASELGKYSQTSAATVIRLCKRIGIPSFTQVKVLLSREVVKSQPSGYADIKPNETVEDIMDKLLGNAFQSMQDTVSTIQKDVLLKAVEILENASIIYVYGVGASNLVAQNIAHKWSRIGKTCISISDSHQLIAAMSSRKDDAVFFGISNSGETYEVVRLLERARENGCQTLGLSRFGKNSLAVKADVSLQHVRANEEKLRSAATSSLHAQFLTVDILFFLYSSKNHAEVVRKIKHSRQEIEKYNK